VLYGGLGSEILLATMAHYEYRLGLRRERAIELARRALAPGNLLASGAHALYYAVNATWVGVARRSGFHLRPGGRAGSPARRRLQPRVRAPGHDCHPAHLAPREASVNRACWIRLTGTSPRDQARPRPGGELTVQNWRAGPPCPRWWAGAVLAPVLLGRSSVAVVLAAVVGSAALILVLVVAVLRWARRSRAARSGGEPARRRSTRW